MPELKPRPSMAPKRRSETRARNGEGNASAPDGRASLTVKSFLRGLGIAA